LDPTGDEGAGAPDITGITVTSTSGTLTVSLSLAAAAAPPSGIGIFFDTDQNAATGSSGNDYALYFFQEATGPSWDLSHWDGSSWQSSRSPSMSFTQSGGTLTWNLGRSDLGGTSSFRFNVVAALFDANGDVVTTDSAPDSGNWTVIP
jgi:hypothetical protein